MFGKFLKFFADMIMHRVLATWHVFLSREQKTNQMVPVFQILEILLVQVFLLLATIELLTYFVAGIVQFGNFLGALWLSMARHHIRYRHLSVIKIETFLEIEKFSIEYFLKKLKIQLRYMTKLSLSNIFLKVAIFSTCYKFHYFLTINRRFLADTFTFNCCEIFCWNFGRKSNYFPTFLFFFTLSYQILTFKCHRRVLQDNVKKWTRWKMMT